LAQAPSDLQNISSSQGGNNPDLIRATFFPEDVRSFPKTGSRKLSNRGKMRMKTDILIDTPGNRAAEEEKN
jgi:hypothetical protein